MTNAATETLIPDGYALARLNAINRAAAKRAVEAACRRYIRETWIKIEAMIKAYGVRDNPDQEAWLAAALLIPDAVWAEYAQAFPKRYKRRWDKFQRLRQEAEDGRFAGAAEEADRIVRALPVQPPPERVIAAPQGY